MLSSVKRVPLFFVVLLCLIIAYPSRCIGQEIKVNLVWKFRDAGWVQVQIEQGLYHFSRGSRLEQFPKGSILQVGWGGLAPVIKVNYDDYQIFREKSIALKTTGPDGVIKIITPDGKTVSYAGSLELLWEGDRWGITNTIDREEYLKGVVPIEMSSSWTRDGFEALKAQAVAARTFMVKHTQGGKAITDSPDIDQAYLGKDVEGEASNAVEFTKGQILVDEKTKLPLDVFYSAHNGGFTELTNNVWANPDSHYSSHRDTFSDGVGGAAESWRFIISAEALGRAFELAPVKKLELDKYSSGRVKNVRMTDINGNTKSLTGRAFVKAFYPFGQPISKYAFLGSLFYANYYPGEVSPKFEILTIPYAPKLNNKNRQLPGPLLSKIISTSQGVSQEASDYGAFIFNGRGWGHGVGMSQWGAYHMAQLGYTYSDILMYYYDNALLWRLE